MHQGADLWLYFVVVFGIILLPGLDMAYVMASSMLGGRRGGMAAVAGIVAGGACHVLMATAGVAAVLALWPQLFNLILLAGAAYIAWMGAAFLRSDGVFQPEGGRTALPPAVVFRRAMTTSLLNPKAYLFMLAIFPQFLHPDAGPLWLQSGLLGTITALTQLGVYGGLALASGQAAGWFGTHPRAATAMARAIGALLVATAALGAWQALEGMAPGFVHDWQAADVGLRRMR